MAKWALEAFNEISMFVSKAKDFIDWNKVDMIIDMMLKTKFLDKIVLIVGMGRSGLVGKAFALRLLHLGFRVHVFGETLVPAIGKDDLVIAISGSGETNTVVTVARTAKKLRAGVIAITSRPDSTLASTADIIMVVPGKTRLASEQDYFIRQLLGEHEVLAPLGTLFEVTAMITLDSIIAELMMRMGLTEDELRARHSTIE